MRFVSIAAPLGVAAAGGSVAHADPRHFDITVAR
jgi:hypothetical protein